MRLLLLTFVFGVSCLATSAVDQPLVILVSIDGARWDYPEKHDAPFLQQLSEQGTRIERLTPSFPTKTFPNHYTLVTGLRPQNHGIIHNKFYDHEFEAWFGIGSHPAAREGRWWGGEPIWLTAQRQGLRSACMFWPGSEADIQGEYPDEWHTYDGSITEADRVAQVLSWTARPADKRPHLITLYFETIDTTGHRYGPNAVETKLAWHGIDSILRNLRTGLQQQGLWDRTHLIVTADHGMTLKDPAKLIALADYLNPADIEAVYLGAAGGINVTNGTPAEIVAALAQVPQLRAFERANVPPRLHFSANDRIPEIVLIPDAGWQVQLHDPKAGMKSPDRGDHGYDNREPDMGALFIARGPRIKIGQSLPSSDNIHVYNLLAALLKIEPAPNDGDQQLLQMLTR